MSSIELQPFTEHIEANFPDLAVTSIDLAGEGYDNLAFTVNGEYVFRFPKLKEAADHVEIEAALLPELQMMLDVRIPTPEFVGTDSRTGYTFSGYKRIKGVPLEPDELLDFDPGAQANLAEQVARFVRQLHSFPVEQAAQLGVSTNDFRADYASDLRPIRKLVLPRLSRGGRRYVERLYEDYLGDPSNFDYRPALIHADLSPEHIIYDPGTLAIAGIIDFGDVEIGDPDYELHWLYASYGDQFLQSYLNVNPHPSPDRLLRKLRFFNRADTIADVLFGFDRDEPEIVENSLSLLKKQGQMNG